MTEQGPHRARRPNELIRAVERGIGRFFLDVEIDPSDRRRLALDLIESLASAGIILVKQHRRPRGEPTPPEQTDTFKGKTD